ncbi:MAG: hypothetical protein P4L66_14800 [Acetobacteraceae bacterium]|nr:hypothetical protein [Acetobacteraceae bacterium]
MNNRRQPHCLATPLDAIAAPDGVAVEPAPGAIDPKADPTTLPGVAHAEFGTGPTVCGAI